MLTQHGAEIIPNATGCLPQLWLTCLYFHLTVNQEFKSLARPVQSPVQNFPTLSFSSEMSPYLHGLGKSLETMLIPAWLCGLGWGVGASFSTPLEYQESSLTLAWPRGDLVTRAAEAAV